MASRLMGVVSAWPPGVPGVGQTEEIVVDRTVDLDVVEPTVAARKADRLRVLILRRQGDERVGARKVVEAAFDGRQILDRLDRDVAGRTGARRADQRVRLTHHRDRLSDGLPGSACRSDESAHPD